MTIGGKTISNMCAENINKDLLPIYIENEREWGIIADLHAIRPVGDRVLIVVDPIKTKYDCKDCFGKGYTSETCDHCLGTGKEPRRKNSKEDEEWCRECVIRGPLDRAYGKKICQTCKGQKGTIVIPDNQKKPPLTGVIISQGDEVKSFKVKDRVIFTNYTGTEFVMEGVVLRFACEKDIIGEYRQLKQTTGDINEVQNTELSTTGVDSVS